MKLTQAQLTEFLTKVGLPDVEVVENDSEADFDETEAFNSIDGSREGIIKGRLEETLRGDIEKAIIGKSNGSMRSALVRLTGVDRKLLTDTMKTDEMIETALKHKLSTLDSATQDQQAQIDEVGRSWQKQVEDKETEWSEKYNQLNEKYISRDRLESLMTMFESKKAPITWDKRIAAKELDKFLTDNYHVVYDEDKKAIALHEKGNPTKVAMNATNTLPLDIMDVTREYLTPRKGWATNTADAPVKTDGAPYRNPLQPKQPEQPKTQGGKTVDVMKQFIATPTE